MKLIDPFGPPRGRFQLDVFRRGVLVDRIDEQNLIVDLAKQTHARLLGGDTANRSVSKISFGTSGTAPAGGNTTITGAYTKSVDSVSYPATNQVAFAFSLATGENNGMSILEFGLLTTGNTLYARRTRSSALIKTVDLSFSGLWTITF